MLRSRHVAAGRRSRQDCRPCVVAPPAAGFTGVSFADGKIPTDAQRARRESRKLGGVNLVFHLDESRQPGLMRWIVAVAWIVIVAKCAVVWWAINRWNVPVHPLWVVGPTLATAAFATLLWVTHDED